MKLSIIVPVYNVEKYIVKCISSLLDQQTNDYEIIIVNDGTKDKSIDLIKKTFNDSKIAIIEQENQGLSAARNTGVRHSKGEYIWFVDSDDWIAKGGIDELIPILDGHTELVYQSKVYHIIENLFIVSTKLLQIKRFSSVFPNFLWKSELAKREILINPQR